MRQATLEAGLSSLVVMFALAALPPGAAAQEVDPSKKPLTTRQATLLGSPEPKEEPPWVQAVKNPVPWFSWGADFRAREEYVDDFRLNRDSPDTVWHFQRYRPRVWGTLKPADFLEINARGMWEYRHWCDPDDRDENVTDDAMFDNLNIKLKPADGVSVTVGRQDIILGDGWLVLEGTPLDGSTTIFFDAARATIELKPAKTTIDAIWIYQFSEIDHWLPPLCNSEKALIEQDERGAILWVTNKSLPATELNGYFIYKHDKRVLPNGDQGEIYTFGGRAVHQISDHWKMRSEGAYQFGRRNDAALSAFGTTNRLAYAFNDKMKNELRMNYEFLSGDDPDSSRNTAFDPLWGRWPQWSELLIYTQIIETRVSEFTNLHRVGPGWQVQPTSRMQLNLDYSLLFADENTYAGRPGFSDDGHFRGQLITAIMRYKFNRFLSGHLIGEYFWPGNYYQKPAGEEAYYLRAELVFSF